MLHLHPRLPHVHLLVLQQLLGVDEERSALQTLVLLTLPQLRDALDGHGLLLPVPLRPIMDLLVDQHVFQGVEELVALAAHVLVLHVDILCGVPLLSHGCVGCVSVSVLSHLGVMSGMCLAGVT